MKKTITLALCLLATSLAAHPLTMAQSNPCSMKNPCNMTKANPCSGKPAGFVSPERYLRPAHSKKYRPTLFGHKKLLRDGKRLFNDTSLSSNGLSCSACHSTDQLFNTSFATPFPHKIKMTADRSNYHRPVNAEEFVQFCLLAPMAGKTFPWKSRELAALTAYMTEVKQQAFMHKVAQNPCYIRVMKGGDVASNPCAMKATNPCNMHNPCSMKAKNPCNQTM